MLNDIKFHINSDELAQRHAEKALIETIELRFTRNKQALMQFVPSIARLVEQVKLVNFSVFVDKNKQLNIVDYNTGRTLYTLGLQENIKHQVDSWAFNSARIGVCKNKIISDTTQNLLVSNSLIKDFDSNSAQKAVGYSFKQLQQYAQYLKDLQDDAPIDTFVCLGLGVATVLDTLLGLHRNQNNHDSDKLNLSNLKHLVCYEPNHQWFVNSLYTFDWASLLDYFDQHGLSLFLQIGTDINQIYNDITELHHKLNASDILFFKHLNLPVFNNVIRNIRYGRWENNAVVSEKLELEHQHECHFLQPFSSLLVKQWNTANEHRQKLTHNLEVMKEYYPDIYSAFAKYNPKCWETIVNSTNEDINLYNKYANTFFNSQNYAELLDEQVEYFTQNPSYDGLVLGYSAEKLKHYIHNSFIRQSHFTLQNNTLNNEDLPENVKVLMVLGLGTGQLLEKIRSIKDVQHLVICEPNHDLFYASLFVLDWAKIIQEADKNEYYLYINIGESSSRLFKDVMRQFMQIGPHLLNETYILQAYENPLLAKMYYEVRQQLQVLFALGENFDHVAYGVAHTIQALCNKIPVLRHNPNQFLSNKSKQTPIFIVGNGPSLDENIDIIKECREQIIVVSCGTALQALHRNGITPDFHGEVEQNRANFDWASRIGDFDYLKQITFISVNGIHPDTIKLYKNALFAFKAGESSTHTAVSLYPKDNFHIIEYAYPTVTNMALSFFLSLGFEQLYLVGIDLGFASKTKHHSAASGYYEQGKQIYNYEQEHSVELKVKGNRQPWVYTKTEFNISRMLIEQLLQDPAHGLSKASKCFNLSNGVMIEGTTPLEPESVLILCDPRDKAAALNQIQDAFIVTDVDVLKSLEKAYSYEKFKCQQVELIEALPERIKSKQDIQNLIARQIELLQASKREGGSLFYYYFYNDINASNALLTKASLIKSDEVAIDKAQELVDAYRIFLTDAKHITSHYLSLIDVSGSFTEKRETVLIDINQRRELKNLQRVVYPTEDNELNCPNLIPVSLLVDNSTLLQKLRDIIGSEQVSLINAQMFDSELCTPIWVDSKTDMSNKCIISILVTDSESVSTYSNWIKAFLINHPKQTAEAKLNVVLTFYDCFLLSTFAESFKELIPLISLQFCSLSQSLMGEKMISRFEAGDQSGIEDKLWLETLLLRSQNFYLFNFLINKPQYLKAGLEYATPVKAVFKDEEQKNHGEQFEHNNSDKCSIRVNETNLEFDKKAKVEPGKDTKSVHVYNEYASKAVRNIQTEIVSQPIWDVPSSCYMFKYYVGVIVDQNNCEIDSKPITQVDKTNNRGIKLSRKPFAFELLGPWIDQ